MSILLTKSQERQRALTIEVGSWLTWTHGHWWTDGNCAIRCAEPFEDARLELDPVCTEEECGAELSSDCGHTEDGWEPLREGFVESFERLLTEAGEWSGPATLSPKSLVGRDAEGRWNWPLVYVSTEDDRWGHLQKRFVDAVIAHAQPDEWRLTGDQVVLTRGGDRVWRPLVVALREGKIVGVISPLRADVPVRHGEPAARQILKRKGVQ